MKNPESILCVNSKCSQTFEETITVQKVGSNTPYNACPICFSEVQQNPQADEKIDTCLHHWGYLCEREKGSEIPEECIQCNKSIACMLLRFHTSKQSINEIGKWYKPNTNAKNPQNL